MVGGRPLRMLRFLAFASSRSGSLWSGLHAEKILSCLPLEGRGFGVQQRLGKNMEAT